MSDSLGVSVSEAVGWCVFEKVKVGVSLEACLTAELVKFASVKANQEQSVHHIACIRG